MVPEACFPCSQFLHIIWQHWEGQDTQSSPSCEECDICMWEGVCDTATSVVSWGPEGRLPEEGAGLSRGPYSAWGVRRAPRGQDKEKFRSSACRGVALQSGMNTSRAP